MKTLFNKPEISGVDEVGNRLQQSGYRLTRPRKAVIRALTEANDWLRPEDLLALARRYWRPLGLVTVYRTVTLLAELGYLRRVHLEDRCVGYVRSELGHGHHLLCRSCHQAVEFPGHCARCHRSLWARFPFRSGTRLLLQSNSGQSGLTYQRNLSPGLPSRRVYLWRTAYVPVENRGFSVEKMP